MGVFDMAEEVNEEDVFPGFLSGGPGLDAGEVDAGFVEGQEEVVEGAGPVFD